MHLCLIGWKLRITLLANEDPTRLHIYLKSQGTCGQSSIFLFLAAPLYLFSLNL